MSFLLNPFAFAAAAGDFEAIASTTVGAGGAASIEFTSIPGTYQHLQVRAITKSTTTSGNFHKCLMRVNGVTTSSYSVHELYALGAYGAASQTSIGIGWGPESTVSRASMFGPIVVDILEYADTGKNTTVRSFAGADLNGAGPVGLFSGAYLATTAVSSITLLMNSGNFAEHSTAALYGVKA